MKLAIFRQLSTINKAGYRAYVVGGFVRDSLYGKSNFDIDIATDAPANILMELFSEYKPKLFKYDSIKYKYRNYRIELSQIRKEEYNGEITKISKSISLKEDYLRRDLKANGIYMTKDEVFLDYNKSVRSCLNHESTFIGDFYQKCDEDPIRLIRYIYYTVKCNLIIKEEYQKYNFNSLDFNKVNRIVLNKYIYKIFKMREIDKIVTILKEFNIYNLLFKNDYLSKNTNIKKALEEMNYIYLNVN